MVCVFAFTVWLTFHTSYRPLLGLGVVGCFGGHSVGETPGSIPNPVAKPDCADGTALGRVWESRTPPKLFIESPGRSELAPESWTGLILGG